MTKVRKDKFRKNGPSCRLLLEEVNSVGDFLDVINAPLSGPKPFWFRGHADYRFKLRPSALRYENKEQRDQAITTVHEFRRLAEIKLQNPPRYDEQLKWVQLAQHYGLPTRILDWTQNPVISLYFACCARPEDDGLVIMFNPDDLRPVIAGRRRTLNDVSSDNRLIDKYIGFDGTKANNSKFRTLPIAPTWNSPRIVAQQGTFTIHGKTFDLESDEAPSLVMIPILHEHKREIRKQLERIGVCEMFIFPELEYTCSFLRSKIDDIL